VVTGITDDDEVVTGIADDHVDRKASAASSGPSSCTSAEIKIPEYGLVSSCAIPISPGDTNKVK